jgi:iron complex transport system substrate-binding protein
MTRVLALLGALLLLAPGCTTEGASVVAPVTGGELRPIASQPRPTLPATVEGADGRTVTVTDVSRIVPLSGGVAEVVFSLGLGASVVGRDVTATFPEAAALPLVTRGHDLSVEGLLSLRPTLVLADGRTGPKEALDKVRAAGAPLVVVPEATSIAGIAVRFRSVAAAVGLAASGEELVRRTDAEVAAARPAAHKDGRPLRVAFLYVRGGAAVYLLGGRGSGADAMVEALGAVDVGAAAGMKPFTPLTAEALVTAAPDAILVMTDGLASVGGIDGLLGLAGVAQTPAGRDRRIASVDDGLLLSFGPRTPYALHVLATALGLRG